MSKTFLISFILLALIFTGCSRKSRYYSGSSKQSSKPRTYSASKSAYATSISKKEYKYAKMKSYVVFGIRYYPQNVNVGDTFHGIASWYGPDFHDKLTANGEMYNMHDMTAAHKTLPMNTVLKVTNRTNGLTAVVRINDRGPFVGKRIIDLSNAAARKINMVGAGTASVTIEVLGFYSKNKRSVKKAPIKKNTTVQKPAKNVSVTEDTYYALQIASFTNIEGALKVQEKYDGTDGYSTVIKDIETDGGRLFKVYLKGFKSETEIRDYKASGSFNNSFIIKENN